ncbi:hypothetical protein WR52_25680 [Bacillus cereus]|nr:hypothetical protein WR52_25680 [Bacillus cereus]
MNYFKKSGSGSLRMRGGWSFRRRGVLCLAGRSEATEHSSRWNWIIKKEWKQQRFIKKGRASFFQKERSGS